MDKGYVCFEIWEAILIQVNDVKTHGVLAPACKTFHEIIESFRRKYLRIALLYRINDQIALAQKCLLMCANAGGDSMAMVHLGFAYAYSGWNITPNHDLALNWLKRASDMKNELAYALHLYLQCDLYINKTELDDISPNEMILKFQKIMREGRKYVNELTNSCAIGICQLSIACDTLALAFFQKAAVNDNCEFAYYFLGEMHRKELAGLQKDVSTLIWYEMAAKQGLAVAQYTAGSIYYYKAKYERSHMTDEEYKFVKSRYRLWFGKAIVQGYTTIK